MKRFNKGDFAFTCNSRAPSVNDGHLVSIVDVLGPLPSHGLAFAYLVERVDGKPFEILCQAGTPMPGPGAQRAFADQYHLRPLGQRRLPRARKAWEPLAPRRDLVSWLAS